MEMVCQVRKLHCLYHFSLNKWVFKSQSMSQVHGWRAIRSGWRYKHLQQNVFVDGSKIGTGIRVEVR